MWPLAVVVSRVDAEGVFFEGAAELAVAVADQESCLVEQAGEAEVACVLAG